MALLKPIFNGGSLQESSEQASIKGLIRLPQKDENIPLHRKIQLKEKSLTDIILEDREIGW